MAEDQTDHDRLAAALDYATAAHQGVYRTGTDIPYITHPIAVMEIVRAHGGDVNQQIAALLHDVVEDAGGQERLVDVAARFGDDVASMVAASTDHVDVPGGPHPDWWERKVGYLARMQREDPRAALVTASDKLHNATAILNDYKQVGDALWQRFRSGRVGQLWYYQQLAVTLAERLRMAGPGGAALGTKLQETVSDLVVAVKRDVGAVELSNEAAVAARSAQVFADSIHSSQGYDLA